MIIRYSKEEYSLAKDKDKLTLECEQCHCPFMKLKKLVKKEIENKSGDCRFCNRKCHSDSRKHKIKVNCNNCDKEIEIISCDYKRHKEHFCNRTCFKKYRREDARCPQCNKLITRKKSLIGQKKLGISFCSKSCATTWRHANNKSFGTKSRSKLELWIESGLRVTFPNLVILFNDKQTLGGLELDIFIPNFLAFELNGPSHTQPIYGEERLTQRQQNDIRKIALCKEKNIELITIDTCKLRWSTEERMQPYLDIIIDKINEKLKERGATVTATPLPESPIQFTPQPAACPSY